MFLNFTSPKKGDETARMETSLGTIDLMLFPAAAPKAVENFLTHAKNGYFDGLLFHRVIRGFMIQSGDPQGTGMGGESIWGRPFENEVSDAARNFRGALCMANAGPDTNGSQFYVIQAGPVPENLLGRCGLTAGEAFEKYRDFGGAPWLDGGYTVFGQATAGLDVVDKIAAVRTDASDRPLEDVRILKISVKKYEE